MARRKKGNGESAKGEKEEAKKKKGSAEPAKDENEEFAGNLNDLLGVFSKLKHIKELQIHLHGKRRKLILHKHEDSEKAAVEAETKPKNRKTLKTEDDEDKEITEKINGEHVEKLFSNDAAPCICRVIDGVRYCYHPF